MAKRKSFEDELTPEATSFLHTGRSAPAPLTRKGNEAGEQIPFSGSGLSTQQLLAVLPPFPDNALTPLNVRINPVIARALMQASMVRKFQQQAPWSQREMVTEALEEWLKKNGFLAIKSANNQFSSE
jgi:hypothetical protein